LRRGRGYAAGVKRFSARIIAWQRRHGRHDLPWQTSRDPYRIWLSEIMLQQTQVATVIPYFLRFVARFPDLESLAGADEDAVLALWSGLGYYSRARNLQRAARIIATRHGGRFPADPDDIRALPGVGRSTAAAIAVFAFGARRAILDGNVRRVLARHGGIDGWTGDSATQERLWALAESHLPDTGIEAYTQGLMDLGATVCRRAAPACDACPVAADCVARKLDLVACLPTPRPRRTLPERHVQMLLVIDRGAILLEKRPADGVWPGLWSLPEAPAATDVRAHCEDTLGVAVEAVRPLAPIRHALTHFKLAIAPQLVHARARADAPGMRPRLWLPTDDALAAALPAPVRALIARLPS